VTGPASRGPEAAPAGATELPDAATPDDPAFEAHVLRAFVRGGRIVSLPARLRRKLVVLRFLLEQVLPDLEPVEERELNMRIALWHPDVAALRRYLVDTGLASRAGMTYRRAIPPRAAAAAPERQEPPSST
jgi:hypothetical protein